VVGAAERAELGDGRDPDLVGQTDKAELRGQVCCGQPGGGAVGLLGRNYRRAGRAGDGLRGRPREGRWRWVAGPIGRVDVPVEDEPPAVAEAAVDEPGDLADGGGGHAGVGVGQEPAEGGEGIDGGEKEGGPCGRSGGDGFGREQRSGHRLVPRYR
jgi:hypothetical protein